MYLHRGGNITSLLQKHDNVVSARAFDFTDLYSDFDLPGRGERDFPRKRENGEKGAAGPPASSRAPFADTSRSRAPEENRLTLKASKLP